MHNALEGLPGAVWYFWIVSRPMGQALVRCLAADEDPEGTETTCESYDPAFTQTDQSGVETKAGSVSFLLRREREEFSINLFHLVLWSCFTKHCLVCQMCQVSCLSESPLWEPCACSHGISAAAEAYVCLTSTACILSRKYVYKYI